MRVLGLEQVRDACLRAGECAAGVDLMHQVEALEGRLERARELDGARVVDQNVDAAEGSHALCDGSLDLVLAAHVHDAGESLAARLLHLLGRRVDRPRELGVWLGSLRSNDDVRAIGSRAQRDGFSDAATGPGDEKGLSLQCRHAGAAYTGAVALSKPAMPWGAGAPSDSLRASASAGSARRSGACAPSD